MRYAVFSCSVGYFQELPQAVAWSLGGLINSKF